MDFLKRTKFDKLVEKATSELLIEPDLENILLICDLVRSQEITPKYCVQSIKRRLQNDNPNVVLHAIEVLESAMKNCGEPFHQEVSNSEFMQCLVSLIDASAEVRSKLLECLQNWAYAFKDKSGYESIVSAYEELKNAGYVFPKLSENDAMFSVMCAPSWKEGNSCHRCKTVFTTFRRKHHCRHCGNIFCAECSSERAVLPKFGIEKEVRVCDHCFETLNKKTPGSENTKDKKTDLDHEEQLRRERERKQRELQAQEAEELQLALALSASEAECKERERQGIRHPASESYNQIKSHDQSGSVQLVPMLDTSEMDPELAQYLNRHYQRSRGNAQDSSNPAGAAATGAYAKSMQALAMLDTPSHLQPSAPIYASPTPKNPNLAAGNSHQPGMTDNVYGPPKEQAFGVENSIGVSNSALDPSNSNGVPQLTDPKQEEFLNALRGSIDFFVNRLQSNSQRGRSIANDTTVQTLFRTLHEMHPQLLQYKKSTEECRAYFERFQDKLTQLREAREALDALRQDHRARRQLEEQEAARIRQLQMMQKLEVMRQQKRDHLEQKLRMAMEQTMQYQQQYQMGSQQQQPTGYGIDPNMMPMGAYNHNYPAGYAPPGQNPVGYGQLTMGSYSSGVPDHTAAYGQPMAYPNHQQQQPPPQQQTNCYMMQPPVNQQGLPPSAYPVPNSTNDASAYSMYALQGSLPPVTTHLSAGQLPATHDPNRPPEGYAPSYDPNIPQSVVNNQNFQAQDGHQPVSQPPPQQQQQQPPYQPNTSEAQLISFD